MTIRDVNYIFDHFYDKFRDESIESFEFCRHINTAQVKLLTDAFHSKVKEPLFGFDQTEYDVERWKSCIESFEYSDTARLVYTDKKGRLYLDSLKSHFPDDRVMDVNGEVETKKPAILKLLNAARYHNGEWMKCKWTRHNDIRRDVRNPFRSATEKYPLFTIEGDLYRFLPAKYAQVVLTLVRLPLHVWYDDHNEALNVDPELPDSVMYDVIVEAVKYAGINIREKDLYAYMDREK